MMVRGECHRDGERRAVEQLLGDERLTSDLVDEAARLLLSWGMMRLGAAFQPADELSQAELSAYVGRLRRMMRRINERAGQAPADRQAERVRMLLSKIERTADIDVDNEAG